MRKADSKKFPLSHKAQSNQHVDALRSAPVTMLLGSIELMVAILQERGIKVKDWEHKERTLKQIRRIGNEIYFLAETEGEKKDEEKRDE